MPGTKILHFVFSFSILLLATNQAFCQADSSAKLTSSNNHLSAIGMDSAVTVYFKPSRIHYQDFYGITPDHNSLKSRVSISYAPNKSPLARGANTAAVIFFTVLACKYNYNYNVR